MVHKALEPLELKLSLFAFGSIHLHKHIALTRTNIIISHDPIRIPLTIHPLLPHPITLKVPRLHRILPLHSPLLHIPLHTEFRFDLKHRKRISEQGSE
jgi:hypothetical protein